MSRRHPRPHHPQGEQHRTPGRVAPSAEAIAKRLRQDPPAVVLTAPRQNGRSQVDAAVATLLSAQAAGVVVNGEVDLGAQARWEREQQRLAREAMPGGGL